MNTTFARVALVALTMLLIACNAGPGATTTPTAAPGQSFTPSTTPSPSPTASPSPSPTIAANSDVAIVRIEQTGGMIAPWMAMQEYPSVALYGDGRLIMQGPQIELYPGPALPNLVVTHLTQRGVEQVLQWAEEAGLKGEDRFLGQPIMDAGVYMYTVVTAAGTHHTSVTDLSENDLDIAALVKFRDILQSPRQWLPDDIVGDDVAFAWDRLRVISFVADPATIPDPQLSRRIDWPLEPLATLGASLSEPATYRCFVVESDALAALRPLLEQANELTVWHSDDTDYQLYLHPVLPDDESCPGWSA